jgi:predicted CXXCH cytochrome family protein
MMTTPAKLALGVLAILAGIFPHPAVAADAATPPTPPERAIYRDVRGRVVDAETGQPAAGVVVSLLYEMAVSDAQGQFVFEKVPLTHGAQISVRVRNRSEIIIGCTTLDVPVRFYPLAANWEQTVEVDAPDGSGAKVTQVIVKTAVAIIDPGTEEDVELRLHTVSMAELSDFCSECHDSNPCLETTTYEEVVKTGKDLRGILVYEDELEAFRKKLQKQGLQRDSYRKIRYQDTHPDGMNMQVIIKLDLPQYIGRYAFPEGLPLLEGRYVTCGTCHSRHVPTEVKQYVTMPYEEDNQLCFKCHL